MLAAGVDSQCKLLIVIDQFEELLTQAATEERDKFVAALEPALGGPVQVVATMRPEFLDAAIKDAALSKVELRIDPVQPLQADALWSVIEEPAKVAGLRFDEDLVPRLVADTATGDALPLLAFTLQQLAHNVTRGAQLTYERYLEIGGVRGALASQADAALEEACSNTGVVRDEVISALLDLVTIDENGRPTKRRVAYEELSHLIADELDPFVARRLLSTYAEGERTFVTVAHEAFLMYWPPLKDEIDDDVTALRARRIVENAAQDWAAGGRDRGALLRGRQLTKLSVDIGAARKVRRGRRTVHSGTDANRLSTSSRLFHRRRLATRVCLNDIGHEFLHRSIQANRARRARAIVAVVGVIALLFGSLPVAVWRQREAEMAREASVLQADATAMLAQTRPGGDLEAFQKLIAANALVANADPGWLLDALISRASTSKIAEFGTTPTSVAFSADGKRMATVSDRGAVQVWNAETGQPIGHPLSGGTGGVALSPDGRKVATTGANYSLLLWDADTGLPIGGPLTGPTNLVTALAFSPDGQRVASADGDRTVRIWNADNGDPVGPQLTDLENVVTTLAFSPVTHRLAIGDVLGNVSLLDAYSGALLSTQQPRNADKTYVSSLAFSRDGTHLVSGDGSGTMVLRSGETAEPVGSPLEGHTGAVTGVAFTPDGRLFASASADQTVRVRNSATGETVGAPLTGHADGVLGVEFTTNDRLVTASKDATVRFWNVDGLEPKRIGGGTGERVLLSSPDGHRVVTTTSDADGFDFDWKTVRLWNADTAQVIESSLGDQPGRMGDLAFSQDGHRLATVTLNPPAMRVWDTESGKPVGIQLPTDETILNWSLSPDGRRVAIDSGSAVGVWNVDNGRLLRPLDRPPNVTALSLSPDGRSLATGDATGRLTLWNADTGKSMGPPVAAHVGAVSSLAFSDDGTLLASGGSDGTVRLWNPQTGDPVRATLTGHKGMVSSLAFSPGRHLLASGGDDKTVRLWNVDTGLPLAAPISHQEHVLDLTFSSDGRHLLSASEHGLREWPIVATSEMLCDKLTANMTHEQWRMWISPDLPYKKLCPNLPGPTS